MEGGRAARKLGRAPLEGLRTKKKRAVVVFTAPTAGSFLSPPSPHRKHNARPHPPRPFRTPGECVGAPPAECSEGARGRKRTGAGRTLPLFSLDRRLSPPLLCTPAQPPLPSPLSSRHHPRHRTSPSTASSSPTPAPRGTASTWTWSATTTRRREKTGTSTCLWTLAACGRGWQVGPSPRSPSRPCWGGRGWRPRRPGCCRRGRWPKA